jgi:hypothetical protein
MEKEGRGGGDVFRGVLQNLTNLNEMPFSQEEKNPSPELS